VPGATCGRRVARFVVRRDAGPVTATSPLGPRLRAEVGLLRARETRRVFDTTIYVGTLGGERDSFVARARDVPAIDEAVRVEVVSALLERTPDDYRTTWLTRVGTPDPYEQDLAWQRAARTAFAMHGRPLEGCFAVTRYGWRDVLTGESRRWKRLRL
jgi:hypothetical protein